jgi:hypothetical protein
VSDVRQRLPLHHRVRDQDGSASAIVYAACHTHDDRSEAWLDVIVGSFEEPAFADQATFSCRVRSEGATLFPAPLAAEGRAPMFGKKLSAEEAIAHELLPTVWAIVDFVVTSEPTIRASVYGTDAAP